MTMSNDKVYYIQIHRSNLADYIQKAILTPARYVKNRIEEDIQSKNSNLILISDGYFQEFNKSQILLEIILPTEEIERLNLIKDTEKSDNNINIFAYYFSLPITRIKQIRCYDKEVKLSIENNLLMGDIGYLPQDIKVFSRREIEKLPKYHLDDIEILKNDLDINDVESKLLKFDKIMGMFAFLKNTNFYFSNQEKIISNYSNYYFDFLSLLNTQVETSLSDKELTPFKELLKIIDTKETEKKKLIDRLYSDKQIDQDFINQIGEIDKKLFDEMKKSEVLDDLKNSKKNTQYYASYLYCNRFKDDKESLKFKIVDVDIKKAEILLAMFGLYYGYSNLRAKEYIEIEDIFFKKFLDKNNNINMKFLMNSKLDYVTVESIYQYVFNGIEKNDEFTYLIYPKYKKQKNIEIPNLCYEQIHKKTIIDVPIFKYRFLSFENLIKNRYPDEISDKYYLYKFYRDELEGECKNKKNRNYITKDDFIRLLNTYENVKNKEKHLISVLDMDKKYYKIKSK